MEGLRSQKKRSLHGVNEYFFDERNAAGGHYGQTLNSEDLLLPVNDSVNIHAGSNGGKDYYIAGFNMVIFQASF